MLKHLHIENYAIIDSLDIDFGQSLNTITGQTGAGKSIILGALGLLSGSRADSSTIATDQEKCIIEGEFSVGGYGLEALFEQLELDWEEDITIRRIIQRSGKSRAFIGDVPVTLQTLKSITEQLIDIHSQHQTLLLARDDFQRQILDAIAGNTTLFATYTTAYAQYRAKKTEIEKLREAQKMAATQTEFITYQVAQLQEANILPGEQTALEQEQKILQNSTELIQAYGCAQAALEGGDSGENGNAGVLETLRQGEIALSRIANIESRASELQERISSCLIELRDIASELEDQASNFNINPNRQEIVEQRLDLIYTLNKKHGVENGDQLAAILEDFETQLLGITGGDHAIEKLESEAKKLHETALKSATQLSEKRTKTAPTIETFIAQQLEELGIKSPKFIVKITPLPEPNHSGVDKIEFLFSANERSAPQQIEGVASGGEMSRLMLAIKNLVASKIKLPTIIFDEIDTGVSGAVADSMGNIIEQMSQSMQVLNITHLPQVAAKGTDHFEVYKDHQGTHIRRLFEGERVEKIAQMLSGATVTDAARQQAQTLLNYN